MKQKFITFIFKIKWEVIYKPIKRWLFAKILPKTTEEKHALAEMLFTDGEKYLIKIALDARAEYLDKIKVTDSTVNYHNTCNDISKINRLSKIFSTDLYN